MYSPSNTLKVGVGRSIISPEETDQLQPTGMTRLGPTRGILDDLTVEAVAISVAPDAAFVLSGDLRCLQYNWVEAVRLRVSEAIGCDPKRILFGSTHNHCSNPEAENDAPNGEEATGRAVAKIVRGIGNACLSAYDNLRPAEMASFEAHLHEPIGEVRRMRLGNGTVVQCWGSGPVVAPGMKLLGQAGPASMKIDGMAFREPGASAPFALLTSYPSHPHLYELPYFSGETSGAVKRELERRFPGLTHVYANGTGGDIDMHFVHPMPSDEEEAIEWFRTSCKEISRRFAEAVEPVLLGLDDNSYTGTVSMQHRYWSCFEDSEVSSGRMIILNALVLNDSAIVSIPAEIFSSYGRWMHDHNPFKSLLLVSYNGSSKGYIGTPIAFEQGGYETMRGAALSEEEEGQPMVAGKPNLRARVDTGQLISEQVVAILNDLKD